MSSIVELGRLERVELREAWPHEAGNFTPWLALPENLALLGEALGIELVLEAVEKPVETFSADILAKDIVSERWVLIENQLEMTDHSHLGQILTYAAGLDAHTIVWIAREFRDPHRAAIDFLNRISAPEFNFFGIQIELLRIGSSAMAPRFNIVAKPNDWSKEVFAKAVGSADAAGRAARWQPYWSEFLAYAKEKNLPVAAKIPPKEGWCRIAQLKSGAVTAAAWLHYSANSKLRALIWLQGEDRLPLFDELYNQRQQIESDLQSSLVWERAETMKSSFISLEVKIGEQPEITEEDKMSQFKWFVDNMKALIAAMRKVM